MAETLPTVDFNFDELRQRMAQFTQRFDEFIERGRKRVLEEKNAFRMNVADLEGKDESKIPVLQELTREQISSDSGNTTSQSLSPYLPTMPRHSRRRNRRHRRCTRPSVL